MSNDFVVKLWAISTHAEMIRRETSAIEAIVQELSACDDEAFDSSCMDFDRACLVEGETDDTGKFVCNKETGQFLAETESRRSAKRVAYDENDNESVLDSVDFLVYQKAGILGDDFWGTVYFVLNEKPEGMTLLAVPFST